MRAAILIFCKPNDRFCIFSSPEPKAQGELIVYRSSRRLSVCGHFQTRISQQPVGNHNDILTEPSLGRGKGSIRFWARSDRNSGVHGNG